MKMKDKNNWYTIAEIADMVRVSTRTISRLIEYQNQEKEVILFNRFRGFRVGNRWRFEELTPKEQV